MTWKYDQEKLARWLEGRTGTGLVDASQRELFLTGFTSNRARQNVASYLAKHLGLDWRLGAEWYECEFEGSGGERGKDHVLTSKQAVWWIMI